MLTRYRDVRLLTPRGVFRPCSDAGMLIDAARDSIHGDVLDVCTGSGVIALSLARSARTMTAVDSSRAAVFAARLAAVVNRVPLDVVRGDLFEPVAGRTFDVIVSNPPYLPTPGGVRKPCSHAWDGGHDGRSVLDRLCREAPARLRPGGELFVVQSSLAGTERTLTMLADAGLRSSVAAVHRGPLGPQARSQASHLRSIGVLRNAAVEDIVVVRARLGLEQAARRGQSSS